jgi:hypothetical protein
MRHIIGLIAVLTISSPSLAYFSLMDTGDVKKQGEYKVLGETQVLFDSPSGMNLNGRFSTGITEESELQIEAGVGSIDYYLAAFWKWVPFPDTFDQPAIGIRGGLTFADVNNYSTYGFNITPFISKLIDTGIGGITPYGGIQFGLQRNTFDTFSSLQAVIGVEWAPNEWDFRELKDFRFLVEYGIEIDDSFSYVSLGAAYNF